MIISGGANIFHLKIESVLIQIHDIYDCPIFGAPEPEFSEIVVAVVQCKPTKAPALSRCMDF